MGSLFSGCGGMDLGFERAGFDVRWHAEIDKDAVSVLARHWPDVPQLGSVTDIDGAQIEPVDVIIGGFPCQDVSLAGKRKGMAGAPWQENLIAAALLALSLAILGGLGLVLRGLLARGE